MPLMPMPPMPTKWIGPMSRGTMVIARVSPAERQHGIEQPVDARRAAASAARAHRPSPPAASGCCISALQLGRQALGRELRLRHAARAAPGVGQRRGIGGLVVVGCVRIGHQDRGAAQRQQLGHRRGAGAA